jgi:hypothetical protein
MECGVQTSADGGGAAGSSVREGRTEVYHEMKLCA